MTSNFVAVFTGPLFEVEVVKALLESNDIVCVIKDESVGVVTSPYISVGGEIFLLVPEVQAELARSIIDSRDNIIKK